jgi:phosphoribosylanthranilate isomerase
MSVKIKICGLTRAGDAKLAADLGADFLGFIFVRDSPRYRDAAHVARIAEALGDKRPKLVGVFRDESPETIRDVARTVPLDYVQLHGSESDDDIRELGLPCFKTLHVGDALPDTTAHPAAEWLLFDTFVERRAGGSGRRFDWSLLNLYARRKPFLLAGGITPDNVAAAISLVRPDAIDLASGVESEPGIKERAKLEKLFERIRR